MCVSLVARNSEKEVCQYTYVGEAIVMAMAMEKWEKMEKASLALFSSAPFGYNNFSRHFSPLCAICPNDLYCVYKGS